MTSERMNDKRTLILNAALNLLNEKGFHGTTTAEIAQKAGIATGTLFNYFKSKEELINTLYWENKEDFTENVFGKLNDQLPLKKVLQNIFVNAVNHALAKPGQLKFLLQFESSPYVEEMPEKIKKKFAFMQTLLRQGQQDGILKRMPVDLMFKLMHGQMLAFIQYLQADSNNENYQELMELVLKSNWDSIKE